MFLVLSQSDVLFGFGRSFSACPIGRASKLRPQTVGRLEKNVSNHATAFLKSKYINARPTFQSFPPLSLRVFGCNMLFYEQLHVNFSMDFFNTFSTRNF